MPPKHAWMPLALCLLCPLPESIAADAKKDKKEEKKQEPPRVLSVAPLSVTPGATNKLRVRGINLGDVTAARFTNETVNAGIAVKSKTKVDVPKDADAKKVGDSQVDLEVSFAADTPSGTNWFIVVSTNGISSPHPLVVLLAAEAVEEKEPNGGFKQAQLIEPGKTLLGAIKEAADVDVFRIEGKAGQHVRIEVTAVPLGSFLDSLITLYDKGGHIVASNDDTGGSTDSLLVARLPSAGAYFVSVIDAHDRGGPMFGYLLKVNGQP